MAQVDTLVSGVPVRRLDGTDEALDVWHKVGQQFVTVGGGVAYDVTDDIALKGNLQVLVLFPSFGLSVQPSVGAVYGF
jgi:hypothetical protein